MLKTILASALVALAVSLTMTSASILEESDVPDDDTSWCATWDSDSDAGPYGACIAQDV